VDEDRRSGDGGAGGLLIGNAGEAERLSHLPAERMPRSVRRRLDRCADDWLGQCDRTVRHPPPAPAALVARALALVVILLAVAAAVLEVFAG
jgi:hypothetical protein